MTENRGCKPEITYPCQWQYRIIGEDRAAMRAAITSLVDVAACVITDGNASSGGRYISLGLEITVNDETERMRLYQLLAGHPAIRVVL
jgi:putative lipoic acid-binding regulatory protein